MSKYKVIEDDGMVSIVYSDTNSTLDGFIDIYPSEPLSPSPFKSTVECKLFAEIMVKLMESITDD